jgi:hypothetical protein
MANEFLNNLVVSLEFRRQGIARSMLGFLEKENPGVRMDQSTGLVSYEGAATVNAYNKGKTDIPVDLCKKSYPDVQEPLRPPSQPSRAHDEALSSHDKAQSSRYARRVSYRHAPAQTGARDC